MTADPTDRPAGAAGSPDVPQVLFVCTHNAGRSQMAAALLTHHAGDRVRVRSAGSAPADTLNPAVVRAMAEIGLDITHQRPRKLEVDAVQASDVVITMGCGDACPVFPGKRYLDWTLEDPAGQPLDVVRRLRDQIDHHVQDLVRQLAD
jgi:arsenate reductase (thioredoxin)